MWTLLAAGSILTEPQVYGRGKEKDEVVKILINSASDAQELSVLPIFGMGGLGKTTLAQMVFNDQRVTEHFHPKIWLCVSDDFDEKRLIKTIIGNIEGSSLDVEDLASFQKKLQELLNGKRYLLVLDDVWNDDQKKWANLRAVLKVGASGASVLTTTRLEKRAFGYQEEINPNLVAIGKEIVKKSGGVPLAAKTLGGLLRFKREEREWEHVRDKSLELWDGSAEVEYVEKDDVHSGLPRRIRFPSLRKLSIVEGDEADATCFRSTPNLRVLTSLHISHKKEATSLTEETFKSLANLKYLKISFFDNLKELPTSLASLNALKHLEIEFCGALKSLPEEGVKGLTSLTQLSVCNCKMLKCLPGGLQHQTALTSLKDRECPQVEKRCEKGIGEDWHKIAHIPNMNIYSQEYL
ncbi:hypothetical protein KY285_034644 [Solanum tuberosum]|nr:hypothetical protein KY285_034644 [Solanum tuberosum]